MGWIVGYEKGVEGKGRWAVENEERAGGSVRAANYNHSCGWRGEETPRGCAGIHGDGPGGEKDERSVRFQGDGKGCIYPPPIHIGTRRH